MVDDIDTSMTEQELNLDSGENTKGGCFLHRGTAARAKFRPKFCHLPFVPFLKFPNSAATSGAGARSESSGSELLELSDLSVQPLQLQILCKKA